MGANRLTTEAVASSWVILESVTISAMAIFDQASVLASVESKVNSVLMTYVRLFA